MVVSSFLLCDQQSGFNLHCSCASAGFYLFFHTIKLVVKICTLMTSIFTTRCYVKLSIAVKKGHQNDSAAVVCQSVCLLSCNVAVFIVLWTCVR